MVEKEYVRLSRKNKKNKRGENLASPLIILFNIDQNDGKDDQDQLLLVAIFYHYQYL